MTPATNPDRIGPYRILARLASGGMGEVFLARRVWTAGFERAVVIKRILPHLSRDPQANAAFLDEARLMALLRHPNIVSVLALARDEGEPYLVMEFLRGETLSGLRRELVGIHEHLDPALAIHVVAELCAGLHAAHDLVDEGGHPLHVVHRDVSPQNVFVTFNGEVKILDFGIASFVGRSQLRTSTGTAKGKFAYMAPEQFAGGQLDRRTDVFAAGVVLHELVTGKRLFARESEAQTMNAILMDPIPLPSQIVDDRVLVPEALDAICARALARDPDERFESADAMRTALRELMPALDPRQRARDRLIEITRRVLPDRFAAAQYLLRRASAESGTFGVVGLDGAGRGSEDGEPTAVTAPAKEASPRARRALGLPPRAPRAPRFARRVAIALAVAAAIGVAVLVLPVAAPVAQLASRPPSNVPADALPAAPRAEIASPRSVPATVVLEVESIPIGASVSIDGARRGRSPLRVEVARSALPVEVVIEHRGRATWTESIVPDEDRRVRARLARLVRSARPVSRGTPPARPRGETSARPVFYSFDHPPGASGPDG